MSTKMITLNDHDYYGLPEPSTSKLSVAKRKELLDQALVRNTGAFARVETRSDIEATLVTGKPVNHILHLILSLVTLGLWLIVWFFMAITGGEKTLRVSVDDYGKVTQVGP